MKVCLLTSTSVFSDAWLFVHALHPLGHTGILGFQRELKILRVGLCRGSVQLQDLLYVLDLVEHCDVSDRHVRASDVHFWRFEMVVAGSDWLSSLDGSHELGKRLVGVHGLDLDIVIGMNLHL